MVSSRGLSEAAHPQPPACPVCAAPLFGPYCAQCGEAATHHDYSMKHVAEELVETFAHVDGRALWSFRALITQPGLLAREFLRGRRKTQMGPVQLFVICNVIYFLVQPLTAFAPFTSTLQMQTVNRPWRGMASAMVAAKVAGRHLTTEEYAREFNEAAHLQGKSLVILMVPLFALGAWALHGRSRRFYAEHLVFAFYAYAFFMLWMAAGTLVLTKPVLNAHVHGWSDAVIENVFSAMIALPIFLYSYFAARRTYGETRSLTAVKSVGLAFWLAGVLTVYRFILFFSTFYAT